MKWIGFVSVLCACHAAPVETGQLQPCTPDWYRHVEAQVPTGDGAGHGPDPGSHEWKSVVEFKLGIRGDPRVPAIESDDWCRYIDAILAQRK